MKKYFNKELVWNKIGDEHFENSTKCCICDKGYVDFDFKVRHYFHISEKYRVSPYRDCNIKFKLNHKGPIAFHNLKNYDCILT